MPGEGWAPGHRLGRLKLSKLAPLNVSEMNRLMEQDGHYKDIAQFQLYGDEEQAQTEDKPEYPSHMDRVRDQRAVATAAANADRGDGGHDSMGK